MHEDMHGEGEACRRRGLQREMLAAWEACMRICMGTEMHAEGEACRGDACRVRCMHEEMHGKGEACRWRGLQRDMIAG